MPRIRAYRDDDLGGVIDLWRNCDLTRSWNPPERDIAFCRGSGHGALFVAEDDGGIRGSVMVGHDGHRGWIYYLAVDPAYRRSGLGRRLVGHAEDWLAA